MRPCTRRIASAEKIIKATSLDDLLVDLISSGWQGIDRRLERIELGETAEIVSLHDHVAAAA